MEAVQVLKGHITRYNPERHFGLIETEDNNTYFFFIDKKELLRQRKSGLIKQIHKYCSGDEVEFKLKPSQKDATKFDAYDVIFIRNERRELLIEESNKNTILLGYLKQFEDKFMVKHISTYVMVEVKVSKWETDLSSTYYERINKLIEFELTQTKRIDKLFAILCDRKFKDDYEILLSLQKYKQPISAIITGKNTSGFFTSILKRTINAFLPCQKDQIDLYNFQKGDEIQVIIKRVHENGIIIEVVQ